MDKKQDQKNSDDSYEEYLRNKKSRHRRRSRSRSKSPNKTRHRHNNKNNHYQHQHKHENNFKKYEYGKPEQQQPQQQENNPIEEIDKEKPNFEPSGILAEFSNKVNGTVLKFTEPLDACLPDKTWRLYPFKSDETLAVINLNGQSNFLIGKDPRVADIIMENPTVSSQHAVIQFRSKQVFDPEDGAYETKILPYIMDLMSTNGTILNGEKVQPQRYIELRNKDILKFGFSSRDYVLMQVFNESEALF